MKNNLHNKALHLTALPGADKYSAACPSSGGRSLAAGELGR